MVCGVLIAGMLPIFGDVSASEDTLKNDGYFYVDEFEEFTFSWDYDNPTVFIVNDENVIFSNDTGLTVSVIAGNNFAVRYTANGLTCNFYGGGSYITADATNKTLTCSLSEGSFSVSNGVSNKTMTGVTKCYVIQSEGPYVMKKSTSPAYMNEDSILFASGLTYSGNTYIFSNIVGTIDDATVTVIASDPVVSDQSVNYTEVTSHIDLYSLADITYKVTNNNVVYNVTYSYFVVPAEVTAERTAHMTDVMSTIIQLVPLLAVVGLVLATIGYILYKRL